MHKSFIAIALALTLTSTFAAYITSNYEIAPVSVAQDSEIKFTNHSFLSLVSLAPGSLQLLAGDITVNAANLSSNNWNLFYRQLNTKTQDSTASIVAPINVFFYNSYAVGFGIDSDSGAPNIWAYQAPLTSGTAAPGRLQLSSNTNNNFSVTYLSNLQIGNTVYVAYYYGFTVNITSFNIGATAPETPFTLSTTFDTPYSLSLAWGKALSNNQLFAVWSENGVLKDAVINVCKRTVATPTVVPGYNTSKPDVCIGFVTDEILYGEFCFSYDSFGGGRYLYWVRTTANGTLVQIANYSASNSSLYYFVPYGRYLAVFFQDITSATGFNYAYEIWDLETFNTSYLQPRKQYLNIDSNSTQIPFRVVSGGLYTLLYNNRLQANGTLTNVQVGLLLGSSSSAPVPGSSYLASVLGFLRSQVRKLTKN